MFFTCTFLFCHILASEVLTNLLSVHESSGCRHLSAPKLYTRLLVTWATVSRLSFLAKLRETGHALIAQLIEPCFEAKKQLQVEINDFPHAKSQFQMYHMFEIILPL